MEWNALVKAVKVVFKVDKLIITSKDVKMKTVHGNSFNASFTPGTV